MGLVFLFLYAPIFVLIVFSFNDSKSRTVWNGFTLNWYVELFQDSQIIELPVHHPAGGPAVLGHRHRGGHLRRHRLLQHEAAAGASP